MSALARSALWYARHGWRVFPCMPHQKEPAIKAWQKQATSNPAQIEAWWRVRPDCNIGLACGAASNVYVLDIDKRPDKDGDVTMSRVVRRLGALPSSVEQRTGSGGRQMFFRYPEGHECRNTAGERRGLGAGIDTRGEGGFVVVPPSIHPCGDAYRWIVGPHQADLAPLPDGWVERLERRANVTIEVPMPPMRTWANMAEDVITRRTKMVAHAAAGGRNDELYRSSFYLAKLAESALVDWHDARRSLAWAGRACGLDPIEIERTIHSAALGAGLER